MLEPLKNVKVESKTIVVKMAFEVPSTIVA
jgi:hypothetical protein